MPTAHPAPLAPAAVYDIHGVPHSRFARVCLRCGRPMNGWSFHTFYGIVIDTNGHRVSSCGEPLHDHCQHSTTARPVTNETAIIGQGERTFHLYEQRIEVGIYRQRNGRYAARVNQKRLGTFATVEEARTRRTEYKKEKGK